MIFAAIGNLDLLKNSKNLNLKFQNDMIFCINIGITGVYISSAFIRLEVFASISIIILSSLGLSILSKNFFQIK